MVVGRTCGTAAATDAAVVAEQWYPNGGDGVMVSPAGLSVSDEHEPLMFCSYTSPFVTVTDAMLLSMPAEKPGPLIVFWKVGPAVENEPAEDESVVMRA